ncbi:MAG: hypothetical protein AB1634_00125 [Thermodesulfobacteriota bacterium]
MSSVARAVLAGILGGLLLAGSAAADRFGSDYPHNLSTNTACPGCHYVVSDTPPPWVNSATPYDSLCLSCHNQVVLPHLVVKTHSSANTTNRYGVWAIECRTCHWPHHQLQYQTYGAAQATGISTGMTSAPPDQEHPYGSGTLTMAGAGWAEDQFNDSILVPNTANPSYNARILDTTSDTLTVSPAIDLTKAAVGNTFAIFYGKLIKNEITTPNSGKKTVRLFATSGANSYADGDANRDGVCEVCHTQTSHFRNDGSAADQLHSNVGGGQAAKNCIACHPHSGGFAHGGGGAGGSGCDSCHGHDDGFGGEGIGGKGTYATHSTHTENDADDLRGPAVGCGACHDTNAFPNFKDGATTLAATTVCNNCHSPGGSYDGVNNQTYGAKANWRTGIYEPNGALKAGKELWCISCHDETPANSAQDGSGVPAPNKAGDGTTYGYYLTGHGVSGSYPATLHGQNGPAYACTACHSSTSAHFSGALGDALRLETVPDDGLASTSTISEVCLDCHQKGQASAGALGFDATAEASIHSGAVSGRYNTNAATAFPAYGNSADYATSPGYQCEDCHEVHGTSKLAMVLPTIDGKVGGASNPVAITGLEASDTDLRDLDPSNAANNGVCDACHAAGGDPHPDTNHANNHNWGQNGNSCVTCHAHTDSFAHGGGGGAPGGGCGSADSCHGLQDAHPAHVAAAGNVGAPCGRCHDTGNMPRFKDGGSSQFNTTVCSDCHHDGTFVATGLRIAAHAVPAWESATEVDCTGCHDSGPVYANAAPKANSHAAHSGFGCSSCHANTTATGNSISGQANHLNNAYDLAAGAGISFAYTFDANGSTCATISCHGGTTAQWGQSACLGCHSVSLGNRAPITGQFAGSSHHVQGVTVEGQHCYQCHWEANSDGSINLAFHGGTATPGAVVNLVLYGAGSRPTAYSEAATGIGYLADGARAQIAKLNLHCLSCHSDQNNDTEPFADCNTPRQYAWDRSSIAARYSQTGTTTWGKYTTSSYPKVAAKNLIKSFSAHGNAISNQGGFDPATGLDATIANTRGGFANVLCFDCHNAHGSAAVGSTSSYRSFAGDQSGGLLKNTFAGKGGYTVSYLPQANTDDADRSPYNTGADLCFDCHMTATIGQTPWGYQQTFGASKPIMGYKDGLRFGTSYSGTKQRFPFRGGRTNQGGHMMASSSLKGLNGTSEGDEAAHQIGGLCTPCHDPHGVSLTLGMNQGYGVPLLKGTWLTSPYQEDSPEMTGTPSTDGCQSGCSGYDNTQDRHWHTDRVTFDTNSNIHDAGGTITEEDEVFAGLCLRCHTKANLTDGINKNTAWKTVDRIHETVRGWGNNQEHTFPCSKCHVPHNSGLPRLMQTNCLDFNHRKQVLKGGIPSYAGNPDHGHGFFPGFAVRTVDPASLGGCHEVDGAAGGGGPYTGGNTWPFVELWNEVTPW